jgi:hypothetical protein
MSKKPDIVNYRYIGNKGHMSKRGKLTQGAQNRLLHPSRKMVQESTLVFLRFISIQLIEIMMKVSCWRSNLWRRPTDPEGTPANFNEQGISTIPAFGPASHRP